MNYLEEIPPFPVKIRYPEYFRMKATTVIPYACGLFLYVLRNTDSLLSGTLGEMVCTLLSNSLLALLFLCSWFDPPVIVNMWPCDGRMLFMT